jgi:excisionase family DNA binding protein
MQHEVLEMDAGDARGVVDPRPLLVDFKTAARLIGVGVSTFYAMDRSGELGPQGIRLRRRRLWRRDELAEWVRAGCPRREKWAALKNSERGA